MTPANRIMRLIDDLHVDVDLSYDEYLDPPWELRLAPESPQVKAWVNGEIATLPRTITTHISTEYDRGLPACDVVVEWERVVRGYAGGDVLVVYEGYILDSRIRHR